MRFPSRFSLALALAAAALVGCGGASPTTSSGSPDATSVGSPSPSEPSGSPTTSPTASPSATPDLPPSLPPSYAGDVPSAEVPPSALVPAGADVTGTWYGTTTEGEAIVVTWVVPGSDPFRLPHGLAVWRRFAGDGAPWRPVYGETWPKRAGVLSVSAFTADVTGDGSDDALVFALTGGSGACGAYSVIDLLGAARVFDRRVCDTTIEPATPTGLRVHEAVFEPDDPHCCPSAFRETVLAYRGPDDWSVVSETETPT